MIKGLLMGLIVFIIVLVINMSKKKEWERRGNSVAVIKKVTYTQPIKVGLFSKPVITMLITMWMLNMKAILNMGG